LGAIVRFPPKDRHVAGDRDPQPNLIAKDVDDLDHDVSVDDDAFLLLP
jgi:hypothetical protein